jgi:hypothetical protein
MALIIKSFWQILKQRKGKPAPRGFATGVISPVTLSLNVHIHVTGTGTTTRKARRKWRRKRYYKKKGGEARIGREWDSDESSTDSSSDEDAANIAINKGLLFPNVGHKCLMAKDDKKRRYILEIPPNTLLSMMRVALVIMKMT